MGFLNNLLERKKERTKGPDKVIIADYDSNIIYSPLSGTAVSLSEVKDPAFAQGFMGKGAAVIPSEGRLYSPASGTVAALFPTNHAIGIMTDHGMELLLHIGLDTVEMKGDGFTAHVKQGDKVSAGQLLITFDMEKIKSLHLDPITMVLVTNYQSFGEPVSLVAENPSDKILAAGQGLFHF